MGSILYVAASPRQTDSVSRRFAGVVLARLLAGLPGACLVVRDLVADPVRPPDAAFTRAILAPPVPDHPALATSEALITELEAADAVLIATPMHNFTVPAVLKAWIDQIVRIHRTFSSTPMGKVGRLPDRPVYLVVTSGGWFTRPSPAGAPPQPDFLTSYLRAIFETIGLRSLTVLPLEGVTRGADALADAWGRAMALLDDALPP
ncbi:FMN-dependent NADH-azoreductase [Rhodopila sp.]|jgi:FMN-dependent NADH-azoreductase|uniref:FMN-dependent NADH-azoreductase n=1 Tax=Rhodopila sp. TaxID=2480087 RepID=UPI002C403E1B|nr:NAD(P)H-dependent oxidoreductase [Rhodopila sp.]HVZ10572.1 NAD(P)H-dependent oxidoreductase [Rhodopila sp.]